ncbi:MAG TPA: FHA domain-containing protein [Bacillota bacterium]|nr:FHA domain-containing protein [Bacillota bacterium]
MPKLIIQEGYRLVGEFVIPPGETSVGRSAECSLVLSPQGVSRVHLRFRRDASGVTMEDTGSRNGTFLNGVPVVEPVQLKHLDVIQLGEAMLVYNELDADGREQTVSGEIRSDDSIIDLIPDAAIRLVVSPVGGNIGVR